MSYSKTSRVSEPAGGEFERNDDYHREAYSGAASDIERMLDKMAEKAACSTLENERIRELTMLHREFPTVTSTAEFMSV